MTIATSVWALARLAEVTNRLTFLARQVSDAALDPFRANLGQCACTVTRLGAAHTRLPETLRVLGTGSELRKHI